jgi:hypothetical protein
MDAVDIAIVSVLMGIGKTYGKKYVVPSQRTILDLLKRFHGVKISRRTLNRRLRVLEDKFYIRRQRRRSLLKEPLGQFRSTMYFFKGKLYNCLHSLGNWISGLFRFYRVPKVAHYKKFHRSRSGLGVLRNVEILWKSPIVGRPTP